MTMTPSTLTLATGEIFAGHSPDWQLEPYFGEVVFTTGMTGYVESLTDPSFAGQILVFTYPIIGNYGVPDKSKWDSDRIQVAGVVIGNLCSSPSHLDSQQSLLQWLQYHRTPLITDVDTRELTKRLRRTGPAPGAIVIGRQPSKFFDPNQLDLVETATCQNIQTYGEGSKRIIAVDCGMKESILRQLLPFPIEIVRVPYDYDYANEPFDGLFISNGPGDPAKCTKTIEILQRALLKQKPTFGICLGAQILALAIGGKTHKLQFGHRGQNHPCRNEETQQCILTSQNHGYAIDKNSLPKDWKITFTSLNDQSIEGIAHKTLPFSAVQFHPEACPGPTDAAYLIEVFAKQVLGES